MRDAAGPEAGRDASHPVCGLGDCKLVFLSSSAVAADAGGAAGFDGICETLARARNLAGAWRAWASEGIVPVTGRMARASVPYRLLDGSTIANGWYDLIGGRLLHAIDVGEDGKAVSPAVEVWTGTSTAGETASNLTCGDWTTTHGTAIVGLSDTTAFGWTFARQQYCSSAGVHIYCFEQ